ncbi:MAG TPA: hypothetical protein PLG59_20870 [bacterium]|nr:hypothetical protein [bacterium]
MADEVKDLVTVQGKFHPEIFIGNDRVVYRQDERGNLKCVLAKVELSEGRGEIVHVPGKQSDGDDEDAKDSKGGFWMLGAAGFRKLGQWPGISVVNPAEVLVDGIPQQNPYVVRDGVGNIISVHARKMAIGRGPSGNWSFTDCTRCFTPMTYFVHELSKAKGSELVSSAYGKEQEKTNPKKKFIETDPALGLGQLIDLANWNIIGKYQNHRQRQKFAEVIAQTMAERNAIKHHPSIPGGKIPVPTNGKITLTVIGWISSDKEVQRIAALAMDPNRNAEQIAREGIDHRAVDFGDDIEDAELIEEVDRAESEESPAAPSSPNPPETKSSPPVDLFDADKSAEIDKQIAAQEAAKEKGGKKR